MICGLVAITPAAGYVDGLGAIAVGLLGAVVLWYAMNRLAERWPFKHADDTLGVVHTHLPTQCGEEPPLAYITEAAA